MGAGPPASMATPMLCAPVLGNTAFTRSSARGEGNRSNLAPLPLRTEPQRLLNSRCWIEWQQPCARGKTICRNTLPFGQPCKRPKGRLGVCRLTGKPLMGVAGLFVAGRDATNAPHLVER